MCLRCRNSALIARGPSAGRPAASKPRRRGKQADCVGKPDVRRSGPPLGPPAAERLACRQRSAGLISAAVALVAAAALTACHRENRYFEPPPGSDVAPSQLRLSPLVAGESSLQFREQQRKEYEENAYHMSEGKRLYSWFNCVGCHGNGGGGSGPPLMDDRWIYGGEIDQIYLTIVQGRPNGMPAFGGKIPSQQIWQLAAYVRSMGGHGPKSARPGRDDNIQKDSEQGRTDEPLRGAPSNENY